MPPIRLILLLPMLAALALAPGCLAFYSTKQQTIQVVDGETLEPVADAVVSLNHMHKLILNAPKPQEVRTDEQGYAELALSNVGLWGWWQVEADGYRWMSISSRPGKLPDIPQPAVAGEVGADAPWRFPLFREPAATLEVALPESYRGPLLFEFAEADRWAGEPGQRRFHSRANERGYVHVEAPLVLYPGHVNWPMAGPAPELNVASPDRPRIPRQRYGIGSDEVALRWLTTATAPGKPGMRWVYVVGTEADAEALRSVIYERVGPETVRQDAEALEQLFEEAARAGE